MKHLNKYLFLALVLCLSLAACGESNEDYSDDGSDYNLYGVPDSFEGLVKDSEQMSNSTSTAVRGRVRTAAR